MLVAIHGELGFIVKWDFFPAFVNKKLNLYP